jgi:CRISPR/Cas system-associated exonuclease Cas4 (RecB family)
MVFLISIYACAFACFLLYVFLKKRTEKQVRNLFHWNHVVSVKSFDLGKWKPKYLKYKGIIGASDALGIYNRCIYIGELKSRNYRGFIKPHEYFQVQLYGFLALKKYRTQQVNIRICYNNKLVEVTYDESIVDALLQLQKEVKRAKENKNNGIEQPLLDRLQRTIPKPLEL